MIRGGALSADFAQTKRFVIQIISCIEANRSVSAEDAAKNMQNWQQILNLSFNGSIIYNVVRIQS